MVLVATGFASTEVHEGGSIVPMLRLHLGAEFFDATAQIGVVLDLEAEKLGVKLAH